MLAMVSVFAWGHEYRHGMVRATLTAVRSRRAVWGAKFLVVGAWVLAVALLTMLVSLLAGWLWLRGDGLDLVNGSTWAAVGRTLVYTLLFTWLAAAFTALVRNQTAALVLLFLWPLAVENVVSVVFALVPALRPHAEVTRFLPFNAGARIIKPGPGGRVGVRQPARGARRRGHLRRPHGSGDRRQPAAVRQARRLRRGR